MDEYRAGMTTLSKYFPMVGRDNADLSIVTAEQQTAFWKAFDEGLVPFAQAIVDYCVEAGANEAGDIAGAAANWGFDGLKEDATVEDFAMAIGEKYSWVFSAMEAETAGVVLSEVMDKEVYNNYPTTAVKYGDSAASISGIEKQDDYNMTVTLTQVDATAIYQLGVTVAPMHYYGDEAQFDYANNKFGFPKGDLSVVRAKTTTPMGAGPYKFIKYENGVVSFESNDTYYKGRPVSKYINFKECISDDDKLNGVTTGTIDITDPAFSGDTVEAVEKENSNKSLTGDKITTSTVYNLGYGYLGMSANRHQRSRQAREAMLPSISARLLQPYSRFTVTLLLSLTTVREQALSTILSPTPPGQRLSRPMTATRLHSPLMLTERISTPPA